MGNKATTTIQNPDDEESIVDIEEQPSKDEESSFIFKFVITTIDTIVIEDVDDEENYGPGAKKVKFHGKIEARKDDDDVAFLLETKELDTFKDNADDEPKHVYEAIQVSKETFQQKLIEEGNNMKFLAVISGFQSPPESNLQQCKKIQNNKTFTGTVIPIIWPVLMNLPKRSARIYATYDNAQGIAFQAGKALQSIGDLGTNISLSLMSHSMGNRLLFSYAQSAEIEKRFENVFMVAADVWEEVFNSRVIRRSWFQPPWNYWNEWKDTGLKLCKMLKDGGKIHIVSYKKDRVLVISQYWENWRGRLGRYGLAGQGGRIHKECAKKLVGLDMGIKYEKEVRRSDFGFGHLYHTAPVLVEYYGSVMGSN